MPTVLASQREFVCKMLALCGDFAERRVNIPGLVTGLQGILDASEIRNEKFLEQWYKMWLPLEIRNATGEVAWSPESAAEVSALQEFLRSEIG